MATALKARLSLSDAELVKLLVRCPQVLGYGWDTNVAPTLDALQETLSLSDDDLRKVIKSSPPALGLSLQSTLLPRLLELQSLFSLSPKELSALVKKYPGIMLLSIESNVVPSASALQSLLGLTQSELRVLVLKYPQALSLSPSQNLAPTLRALRALLGSSVAIDGLELTQESRHDGSTGDGRGTEDGSTDGPAFVRASEDEATVAADDLRAIVLAFPSVLGLSVEANLRPKLAFLAEALGSSPAELRVHIARCPLVLGTSLEKSLVPNVSAWRAALLEAGHSDDAEAQFRTMVEKNGLRVLTASYEKRTRPRLTKAAAAGVPPLSLLPKMRLTDPAFETWLDGQAAARR